MILNAQMVKPKVENKAFENSKAKATINIPNPCQQQTTCKDDDYLYDDDCPYCGRENMHDGEVCYEVMCDECKDLYNESDSFNISDENE